MARATAGKQADGFVGSTDGPLRAGLPRGLSCCGLLLLLRRVGLLRGWRCWVGWSWVGVQKLRIWGFWKGFKTNRIQTLEFEFQQSKEMHQHVCNI
jgi:hypothetical protein